MITYIIEKWKDKLVHLHVVNIADVLCLFSPRIKSKIQIANNCSILIQNNI